MDPLGNDIDIIVCYKIKPGPYKMIQFSQETFLVVNKANNKEGLGPDTVNWHN